MYDNDIIGKIIIDEDDVIEHYGRPHEADTLLTLEDTHGVQERTLIKGLEVS